MSTQLDRIEKTVTEVLEWAKGDINDPNKPGAENRIVANTKFRKNSMSVIVWAAKIVGGIILTATVAFALAGAF